jgi:hypothetical protein
MAAVDLLAAPNPIFWLRTAKKNDWPFGKHGLLENPLFSLMIFPLKPSFGGIFQPTFDFPIFGAIFFTEAMTGRWALVRLWDPGGAVFSDLVVSRFRQKTI